MYDVINKIYYRRPQDP